MKSGERRHCYKKWKHYLLLLLLSQPTLTGVSNLLFAESMFSFLSAVLGFARMETKSDAVKESVDIKLWEMMKENRNVCNKCDK